MFARLSNPLRADLYVRHWRAVWRSPPIVALFCVYVLYYYFTATTVRFGDAQHVRGIALTGVTAVAFLTYAYGVWGRVMAWLAARNVPFVLGYMGLVASYLAAEYLALPLFSEAGLGWERASWYVIATVALGPQISAIGGFLFERRVRADLAGTPVDLPIWWPVTRVPEEDGLMELLPADLRGALLRIEAANQYVIVHTERGSHELRLPLKEAIARLPEGLGVQVHRSLWLAKDQVAELLYRDGNPKARDPGGEIWPVSRARVPAVKALLAEQAERASRSA